MRPGLAQCDSVLQLGVGPKRRLVFERPRNGECATLWVDKHRLAHTRGELADLPKRRQLGVVRSGDAIWVPRRGTRRVRKTDCHNEVMGARASAPQDLLKIEYRLAVKVLRYKARLAKRLPLSPSCFIK